MTQKMKVEIIMKEVTVLEKAAHELRMLAEKSGGRKVKSVERMSKLLAHKSMRTKDLAEKLGLAVVTVYTIGRKHSRRFTLAGGKWSLKH